jgi:hypothetical protein
MAEEKKDEGTTAPDITVKYQALEEKYNQTTAKLIDLEKRFGGVDLDKLKADAAAAKILETQLEEERKKKATGATSKEDFESEWEKRQSELVKKHKDTFEAEINPLKEKLSTYEAKEYERTVVESVLTTMTGQIVSGSEEFWRDMIRKEIKKDSEGNFQVVDEKGQAVYNDGRSALTVAEWVESKKAKYPFLVADRTTTGAHSGSTSNAGSSKSLIPPKGLGEHQLVQWFKDNPGAKPLGVR